MLTGIGFIIMGISERAIVVERKNTIVIGEGIIQDISGEARTIIWLTNEGSRGRYMRIVCLDRNGCGCAHG